MGDGTDDAARRRKLKRDLTRETRRLMQHIGHLGVQELDVLEGIVDDLAQIHIDEDKCVNLARRHSDRSPPWGTRYASLASGRSTRCETPSGRSELT